MSAGEGESGRDVDAEAAAILEKQLKRINRWRAQQAELGIFVSEEMAAEMLAHKPLTNYRPRFGREGEDPR